MKNYFIIPAIILFISANCFAQSHGTGVGIMVGQPTGLTLKTWVSKTSAIALGGAYNFKNEGVQVQADYLYHFMNAFPITMGRIPVYTGIGGTISYKKNSSDPDYGIRLPVGFSYFMPASKFDLFVEADPVIIIKPESRVSLNGNVGIRYFFN